MGEDNHSINPNRCEYMQIYSKIMGTPPRHVYSCKSSIFTVHHIAVILLVKTMGTAPLGETILILFFFSKPCEK